MGSGEGGRTLSGPRIAVAAIVLAIGGCIAHDALVPIPRQYGTRAAVSTIEQYRARVSPRIRGYVRCRFKPGCSAYGLASVKKYGAVRGGARAFWRVVRCNPLTPMGTVDPP